MKYMKWDVIIYVDYEDLRDCIGVFSIVIWKNKTTFSSKLQVTPTMLSFDILCSTLMLTVTSQDNDYDVIIMGAGMAGISAAKTLYDAGIDNFLIIEAQDYIGGRVKNVEFAGQTINSGASWIHGACLNETNISRCSFNGILPSEINPLLDLADMYAVDYVITDYDSELILEPDNNATNLPSEFNITKSDNAYDRYYEAQDCVNRLIAKIEKGKLNDMSYFAALYLCGWRNPLNAIEKTVQWYEFTFEYGTDTERGGALGSVLETYERYGDQDLFVTDEDGYQSIILELADEFLDIDNIENDPRIKLNSPINLIQYDEDV